MISEMSAALATVKGLLEISKAIKDVRLGDAVRDRTIELNIQLNDLLQTMTATQLTNQDLAAEVRVLKDELARIDQWEQESEDDTLHELAAGVFVYLRKATADGREHTLKLCPKCYEDRKRSILQFDGQFAIKEFCCPRCGLRLVDTR